MEKLHSTVVSGASSAQEKAGRQNANCYLAECSGHPFGTSAQGGKGKLIMPNIFPNMLYIVSAVALELRTGILGNPQTYQYFLHGWGGPVV